MSHWQKFCFLSALLLSITAGASDHIDGPATSQHGQADITDLYAFPTPGKPGFLSLVLNANPLAQAGVSHHDTKIKYRFYLRSAQWAGAKFQTADEVRIDCQASPHPEDTMTCQSSSGHSATAKKDASSSEGDFRLFFGVRSDPFFLDFLWTATASRGHFEGGRQQNSMAHLNVLSIVLEVEMGQLFGAENANSLVAVAASSFAKDNRDDAAERTLDWVGRPEITNVSLVANGRRELRDQYNQEQPFALSAESKAAYHQRLTENILFYDSAAGERHYTPAQGQALADVLVDDFLVVNTSSTCVGGEFFGIEKALMAGQTPTGCGGRRISDDIIDGLFDLYVHGGRGSSIGDGVDAPFREPSSDFPYLRAAEKGPMAEQARQIALAILSQAQ